MSDDEYEPKSECEISWAVECVLGAVANELADFRPADRVTALTEVRAAIDHEIAILGKDA